MLRVAAIALAGMLALPAAAHATPPPKKAVKGVTVTWPVTNIGFLPGMSLQVKVRSSHRRTQLSLVRVDAKGKAFRTVARKTLRSGTFDVTIPAGVDRTYQLRATVAGKRYWSVIKVGHALGSPGVPAQPCTPGAAPVTATLALGATSVGAGDALPYTVTNTSPAACITEGAGFGLEQRQSDGSWKDYPLHLVVPLWAALVQPGQAFPKSAAIPADVPGGTYRIVETLTASLALRSDPFQVLASLACDSISTAVITLDPSAIARGVPFSFPDPGLPGEVMGWEQLVGGDWVPYAAGSVDLAAHTASLPAGAPAGSYRLHARTTGQACPNAQQAVSTVVTLS